MEQESFTSSTIFAWHNGLRIVDLGQLARQMHCTQCSSLLDLNCIEKEEQFGLASILYILCRCGTVNDIYSGKNEITDNGRLFEINIKASMSMLQSGNNVHHILNFLALLDIPASSISDVTPKASIAHEDTLMSESHKKPYPYLTLPLTSSGDILSQTSTSKRPELQTSAFSQSCEQGEQALSSSLILSSVQLTFSRKRSSLRCLPEVGKVKKEEEGVSKPDYLPQVVKKCEHSPDKISIPPLLDEDTKKQEGVSKPDYPAQVVKKCEHSPDKIFLDEDTKKLVPKKLYQCPVCPKVVPSSRGFLIHMARLHKEQNILPDEYAVKPKDATFDSEDSICKISGTSAVSPTHTVNNSRLDKSLDERLRITFPDSKVQPSEEEGDTTRKKPRVSRDRTRAKSVSRVQTYGFFKGLAPDASEESSQGTDAARKEPKANRLICRVKDCNKQFTTKDLYNKHLQKEHDISDPHECSLCLQVFNSKISVKKHISRQHTTAESKQITCKYCGEVQVNASRLKKHISAFHPKGLKKTFTCEVCASKFTQKSALKIHMHKHTGERPYKCYYCEMSFYNSGLRVSHVKYIHTKERPFLCDTCGASFFRACNLRDHKRVHSGERPFQCHVCAERFMKREYLTIHVRRHTGERPYKCTECSAAYSQRISLSLHRRKKHGAQKQERRSCKLNTILGGNSSGQLVQPTGVE